MIENSNACAPWKVNEHIEIANKKEKLREAAYGYAVIGGIAFSASNQPGHFTFVKPLLE